jgi:hypothetical protein
MPVIFTEAKDILLPLILAMIKIRIIHFVAVISTVLSIEWPFLFI